MGLWSRIRNTFRHDHYTNAVQEELQFHLRMDMADGHNSREARLRLGNLTRIEEETRATGVIEWLDSALRDARYGLRQLRKTPVLALAVLLSLTIGIGANTAIFSLVDAAILRPLPVKNPDSLRVIEWTSNGFPEGVANINGDFRQIAGGRFQASSVSASLYRNLARRQTGFESLMGVADANAVAVSLNSSAAEQVSIQYVSSNFFQGLGTPPVLGRGFLAEEDHIGHQPVVIISHRLWIDRFDGRRDVLGREIRVNNVPARIVGVAPPRFFGVTPGEWIDVYAPLATRVAFQPTQYNGIRGESDGDWWVRLLGRLKPGVPENAAGIQIASMFRDLAAAQAGKANPARIPELIVLPGRRGIGGLNARDADSLWILMLLVGVLMLIVCLNVANLLLSRSVGKQRESAVRLALGAARTRLFRQCMIESAVLALLGGIAGVGFGYLLARSIHLLIEYGRDASNAFDLHVDARILVYTAALSVITAFLFGLAPAARAARADLNDALKAQARSVIGGKLRLPSLLVSIQVALCLTALVAAGLLGRSLENLKSSNIGFDRDNLAYATVNPWQAGYTAAHVAPYVDRVREEINRLPGVVEVSPVEVRLLSGNGNVFIVNLPGHPSRIGPGVFDEAHAASINRVGDGFFKTLGIALLDGRPIERRDIKPNSDAVVVDERFVQRFFPNQNPLGRRFGFNDKENSRYEIVGVVADSRYNDLRSKPLSAIYLPYVPGELHGAIHFAIRSKIDSGLLIQEVRKAIASVDPAVPMTEFHTQTALIDRLLRTERLLAFLSGAFGLVALTLAAIGIGGLLAYSVARRTNEIGIRMALGAARNDVVRMVLGDSVSIILVGIAIGAPCVYVVGRILESELFRLKPLDPQTAALSFGAIGAIALLAAWAPARRAARIEPMSALREE